MSSSRKLITVAILVVMVVAVWWLADMQDVDRFDISSPAEEDPIVPSVVTDPEPDLENWNIEDFKAFFVEYRLQRDRVRGKEQEMLNQMIDNPNVSEEAKKQAEEQMLKLIDMMEKELLVENMLKAHGFKDAIFFYRDDMVNVVIQAENLSEEEFLQIAEMVSSATGVGIERISVTEHTDR
ncbi:SpoIIIAH-like family protein [Dethiobacter alkaliphilus]|uniref:Stage III sporulation protein AH n=1 Tax=Dethiobacter alkaliphilus AHT 1 TaxID=555088 RepID=C0GE36_DETAL|nr:SpoIIIAH-like family protein [Dethiobacter alkaliphilus]EEG78330.1 hypothetical protein DealDRAFT_0745 [Dethiobacter alkaliphilus AHT 1]